MSPNWLALTKELQPGCLVVTTMSTVSLRDRRSLRHSPSSSEHKLSISGFLPMPPIIASPVCTPTSTQREIPPTAAPSELSELDSADRDHLLTHVVPTWMATPPTPRARRTVTSVHRPSSPISQSASFPATGSVSSSPRRPRALSDSSGRGLLYSDGDRVASPEPDLGSEPVDARGAEKAKDDVRKYHALMELLSTEVSYLADLRAFFSIYLCHLPTLCRTPSTTFGRGSSSRNSSYTHLPKTSVLSDHGLHPLTTIHTKPKPVARPIFTSSEVDLLTRNAEAVLQLHENFVEELRTAVFPLGFPMELSRVGPLDEKELIRNIDAAVGKVSTMFATEAFRFDAYQSFCTGHTEALQLVRRAQHRYPLEWEAYEQHCASLIANMGGDGPDDRAEIVCSLESVRSSSSDSEERQHTNKLRKRTSSLTSLDGAVRRVRSRPSSKRGSLDGGKDKHSHRLAFLDYMIKPVQRICKYPLLLDQLRPGKALRAMAYPATHPHVHLTAESAAQAMRRVAKAVDEARHREAVKMQSSLIISRIALADPASATSHMSTASAPHPTVQILMPSFLSSLGTCLLAGSLDVMHYRPSKSSSHGTNINAKYLGAFLYLGGYLILVKVTKGKVYEPRHWFPLADFDVVDPEEEDTSFPCTFSLTCKGHQFDLTAACQREKDAWLSSIHESRLHPPSLDQ
ncbi:DH domain-containing protein [Mycena sanguinolenta]|uniref:DH domain-containing protein n=1 Tax=Mycena sanguinolenta TaxID=230812 RepID=A0A8H6YBK9_9AGAR|nr:DH domain-containing protein [Mycena sanguinolenta]